MLPLTSSVFTSDFCPASRLTGFRVRYPGSSTLSSVFSRADQQGMGRAAQFAGVADIFIIEEHGRAAGLNGDLQGGCNVGSVSLRHLMHHNLHGLDLSGLDYDFLREVVEARLADGDGMFARQQEHLFYFLLIPSGIPRIRHRPKRPTIFFQLRGTLQTVLRPLTLFCADAVERKK